MLVGTKAQNTTEGQVPMPSDGYLEVGVLVQEFEPSGLSEVSALHSRHCYQGVQRPASRVTVLVSLWHVDALGSAEKMPLLEQLVGKSTGHFLD